MVGAGIDSPSNVVEQGGTFQDESFVSPKTVERDQLIEQIQRQATYLKRVTRVRVHLGHQSVGFGAHKVAQAVGGALLTHTPFISACSH
jgi:hypothetical protein